jgi:hypothetical protein
VKGRDVTDAVKHRVCLSHISLSVVTIPHAYMLSLWVNCAAGKAPQS